MSQPAVDAASFGRIVTALRPWLGIMVFAGGWAHRLYRLHPLAHAPAYAPLMTKDTDIALDPAHAPASGDIRDRLLEAGFTEEFLGEDRPPVTHYHLGHASSTTFAEFLVPLTGGASRRDGTPDNTARVGGVTAQKLRFLELLLLAPWTVTLPGGDFSLESHMTVQVPNPASYLAQKILIYGRRQPESRAKDTLYVHDTLETFADALSEIRRVWAEDVQPHMPPKQVRRVEGTWAYIEGRVTDDVREAARLARSVGRDLSNERIVQVCAFGLRQVFAPSAGIDTFP